MSIEKNIVITVNELERLGRAFDALKEFHDEWDKREDDLEEMWMEAPEMVEKVLSEMAPVMERLKGET